RPVSWLSARCGSGVGLPLVGASIAARSAHGTAAVPVYGPPVGSTAPGVGRCRRARRAAATVSDHPDRFPYGRSRLEFADRSDKPDGAACRTGAVCAAVGNAAVEPAPDAAGDADAVCHGRGVGLARAAGREGAAGRDGAGAYRSDDGTGGV